MNYGLWSIVLICLGAATVVWITVSMIITSRRAKRLGVLRVKYPVWNGGTALRAFMVVYGILMIILSAIEISRNLASLADYQARLPQEPNLYKWYIEPTETSLARNRFQLVCGIGITVFQLLTIFTSGAYITKDGVLFFGGLKPQKTAARLENGTINFYVGKKRQTYAFDLPDNEENRELLNSCLFNSD